LLDKQQLNTPEILNVYKQQQSCEKSLDLSKTPYFLQIAYLSKNPASRDNDGGIMSLSL